MFPREKTDIKLLSIYDLDDYLKSLVNIIKPNTEIKDDIVEMIDCEKWKVFAFNYADEIAPSYMSEKEIVIDDDRFYNWY